MYIQRRNQGNVLFNDVLNTFYFTVIWRVGHMVKDHSYSERGNPLPINSKGSFICTIPQTGLHIPQPLLQNGHKQQGLAHIS